ncbi:MAG: hypothetical protein LBQ05_02375 [Christensenellaceae bacterium]|jgi:hypothetical protein|nr:hypothetical protein [Christensenellaceae bacterium]
MKEIKLSELKKMYPKHIKKKPQKSQKIVFPEDMEECSQAELKKFAKEIKKKQEKQITYYPEYNDETQGIYSRPVVCDEMTQ